MLYDNNIEIKFQRNLPKCGQVMVIGIYVPHISKITHIEVICMV